MKRISLSISFLILFQFTGSGLCSGIERFSIHNMNLGGRYYKSIHINQRISCHIKTFNSTLREYDLDWDLVGINDTPENLYCPLKRRLTTAAECIAAGIKGRKNVWHYQKDEIGLIVNTDKFDVLVPHLRNLEQNGKKFKARFSPG